jgi:hypothetical protein
MADEATEVSESSAYVAQLIEASARWCRAYGRSDLGSRLDVALERLTRHAAVICVAGEFKKGKSLLVNALLDRDVCPVDDDYATVAFTWCTPRSPEGLLVRRTGGTAPLIEEAALDDLRHYVSELGNPDNVKRVELVDVGLAGSFLDEGLSLLDTPGVGGIRGGTAASVLDFLPRADALLFVTDALAELSPIELDFVTRAREACPQTFVILAKIDLASAWRQIAAIDRDHLGQRGIDAPVLPVSAALHHEAIGRHDPELDEESGLPALRAMLRDRVLDPTGRSSLVGSLRTASECVAALVATIEAERQALLDPGDAQIRLDEVARARQRLDNLRAVGPRWGTLLNDGITDLGQTVDADVRATVRSLLEWSDAEIARIDPLAGWEPFAAELQALVARKAHLVLEGISEQRERLAARLESLIEPERRLLVGSTDVTEIDVAGIWIRAEQARGGASTSAVDLALSGLRSSTAGIYMLGMVGSLAGLALSAPISIGVGAAFGAKYLIDERRREQERRRRAAQEEVRRFLGDVQGELSVQTRRAIVDVQRSLRDGFSAEIEQVAAVTDRAVRTLQEMLERDAADRLRRADHLGRELSRLGEVRETVAATCRRLETASSAATGPT